MLSSLTLYRDPRGVILVLYQIIGPGTCQLLLFRFNYNILRLDGFLLLKLMEGKGLAFRLNLDLFRICWRLLLGHSSK